MFDRYQNLEVPVPVPIGWGAEDISCSQPIQCLRLSRWGRQSEFACDCTYSKIYCLDLELQRTVVSPHVSSTVVSPQVGQITNTLVPVPTNFGTGRALLAPALAWTIKSGKRERACNINVKNE